MPGDSEEGCKKKAKKLSQNDSTFLFVVASWISKRRRVCNSRREKGGEIVVGKSKKKIWKAKNQLDCKGMTKQVSSQQRSREGKEEEGTRLKGGGEKYGKRIITPWWKRIEKAEKASAPRTWRVQDGVRLKGNIRRSWGGGIPHEGGGVLKREKARQLPGIKNTSKSEGTGNQRSR